MRLDARNKQKHQKFNDNLSLKRRRDGVRCRGPGPSGVLGRPPAQARREEAAWGLVT